MPLATLLKWMMCQQADLLPEYGCNFGYLNFGGYGTTSIFGGYLGLFPFSLKMSFALALAENFFHLFVSDRLFRIFRGESALTILGCWTHQLLCLES